MTATEINSPASPDQPGVHLIDCSSCAALYDALRAEWCECIVKERTLVCPQCGECFCRADVEYKRNTWTTAPDALWERKQRSLRQRSLLPDNPAAEAVARPLILVVDDDRDVRSLAVHLVTSRGFGCIHADNGADGLALARTYRPDLILTDALMPRMDGRELCRLVKSDPELAGMRVVIMSSVYTAGRFRREALSHFKADDFLAKPVDAGSLLRLIRHPETDRPADATEVVRSSEPGWVSTPPEARAPLLSADPANDVPLVMAPAEPEPPPPEPISGEEAVSGPVAEVEAPMLPPVAAEEPRTAGVPIERLRISARELIRLRALGLDAELAALSNAAPGLRVVDLVALRTAGVPFEYMDAVDPDVLATLAASEIITLHGAGCPPETVNLLRRLELGPVEIIGIVTAGVPTGWLRGVFEAAGRPLTPAELIRLHGAAVDLEYIRALRARRGDSWTVDEWIRLWTLGVTPEFVDAAADALVGECTFEELAQLWLSGVDLALLQQVRPGV